MRRNHLLTTVCEGESDVKLLAIQNAVLPTSLERWGRLTLENERQLSIDSEADRAALNRLIYAEIRDSLVSQGFTLKGRGAYKPEDDLTKGIPRSRNPFLARIQDFLHAYAGFAYAVRYFDSKLFLQLQPRSFLDFDRDMYSLLTEGILDSGSLTSHFNEVYAPGIGGAHLVGFANRNVSDSIPEPPFEGKSFMDASQTLFPTVSFTKNSSPLLLLVPKFGEPTYYSAENVRPSLTFPRISGLDEVYFAALTGKMKAYSATRKEVLDDLVQNLKLTYCGTIISTKGLLFHEATELDYQREVSPGEIDSRTNYPGFFRFQRPALYMKDRQTGKPRDVPAGGGFYASPTDLLHHPDLLSPLDSPTIVSLLVICQENLENDSKTLLTRLNKGYLKFGGSVKDFGCTFMWEDDFKTFKNFDEVEDILKHLNIRDYDCALLIGSRNVGDDPELTRRIYVEMERRCLEKGLPAQYLADDPRSRLDYDRSIKTKGTQPDTLFGIGQNILGKIGAKLFELSPTSTNRFLPNSVVLGYNVIRIFVPPNRNVLARDGSAKSLRKSIPLIAPLVLMTNKGSEIIMQAVHLMQEETELFSAEHAPDILEGIPSDCQKVIIHKDGPFYSRELSDIRKLQTASRQLIPVSIVTNVVPRLFSSIAAIKLLPREGTVFSISKQEFLMVTNLLTTNYIPEKRGWPNPIWIKIHDEVLATPLSLKEKMSTLYQIWALTKANPGSQLPIRRPLSIHYSNKMGTFLRKAEMAQPDFLSNFQRNRNRLGYVPRIFL
jgi:hypothetical protein